MVQRGSSFGIILGLGCGVFVLLTVGGGVAFMAMRNRAMAEAAQAAEMRAVMEKDRRAQDEARRMVEEAEQVRRAQAAKKAAEFPAEKEGESERLRTQVRELEARLAKADARIAELEKDGKTALPAEKGPSLEERKAKARENLAKLAAKGMAAYGGAEMQELIKELKELGADGTALLTDLLLHGASAGERFIAAAALEGVLDPGSVAALAQSVQEEKDTLVRRMAVHALAVGQFGEAKDALNTAMLNDADWGVRVNAAYGLAKQGDGRGVQEMVKWYEAPGTEAQYKQAILGGIADVGDPSTAYIFKNLLSSSQDMGSLLLAIHGATKSKDASLVPDLQKVMDTSKDLVVKEAAEKAIKELRGY